MAQVAGISVLQNKKRENLSFAEYTAKDEAFRPGNYKVRSVQRMLTWENLG